MKKIIAIMSAFVLVVCLAMVLTGCGGDKNTPTTTTTTTNITTTTENTTENPGIVTDESEKGENGVIGDVVTDISEMASDMINLNSTNIKEAYSSLKDCVENLLKDDYNNKIEKIRDFRKNL